MRATFCKLAVFAVVTVSLLSLSACSSSDDAWDGATSKPPFIEAGDLPEILARQKLRILFPRQGAAAHLPRRGFPLDDEKELAEAYARRHGLEPVWIYMSSRDELIPALLEGKADFIAANMTATRERREHVAFTVPVTVVREQLVARVDDVPSGAAQLVGRTVALRRSSSFWATMSELREKHPGIERATIRGCLSRAGGRIHLPSRHC